jgi:hypothetical protein
VTRAASGDAHNFNFTHGGADVSLPRPQTLFQAVRPSSLTVTRAAGDANNVNFTNNGGGADVRQTLPKKSDRLFPAGIDPTKYTLEQLAFLSRKEQGIMPNNNDCGCCDGIGTLVCTACRGTGSNPRSVEDDFSENVRLSSNAIPGGLIKIMM